MPRINKKQIEKMNINELIENYIIKNNISKATFKRNINPLEKRDTILALLSESNNNKWNKMFKKLTNKNKHLKTNISNEIENPNDLPFLTPLVTNSPLPSTSNAGNITINNVSKNVNNVNFWMQRYYQFKNQVLEKQLEEKNDEINWYKDKLEEKNDEINWYKDKLKEKNDEIILYEDKLKEKNNEIILYEDKLEKINNLRTTSTPTLNEENEILNLNLTPNTINNILELNNFNISAINNLIISEENQILENDLYLSSSDEESQNNEKSTSMPMLN